MSSYVNLSSTDLNRIKKISLNLLVCGTIFLYVRAKSLQSRPTLCDSVDHRPPGSSIQGILQATVSIGWPGPPPENLPWREDLFIHLYLNDLETLDKLGFIFISLKDH